MLNPSQVPVGRDALSGKEEYILGHIFEAVDEERWLQGRGTLIMIIHPSDANKTKSYDNVMQDDKFFVPPGHKVKVIDAHVRMTK
ncbi:hypothetical protein N7535_006979 [Penicillium sp. DV-2018c]|nr:hypothetical protein N7461_006932 [Penicillium sp. DV-2018c]KAJ5567673.1 hypothetical protein N7535_006979 [Penicillium sp. DV-2018c]